MLLIVDSARVTTADTLECNQIRRKISSPKTFLSASMFNVQYLLIAKRDAGFFFKDSLFSAE